MPMSERYGCIDIDERRVIPDIEIQLSRVTGINLKILITKRTLGQECAVRL
jgi:hypothetical protein